MTDFNKIEIIKFNGELFYICYDNEIVYTSDLSNKELGMSGDRYIKTSFSDAIKEHFYKDAVNYIKEKYNFNEKDYPEYFV